MTSFRLNPKRHPTICYQVRFGGTWRRTGGLGDGDGDLHGTLTSDGTIETGCYLVFILHAILSIDSQLHP